MMIQDKIEEVEVKRTANQDQNEMIYMISKINQTFTTNNAQNQQYQQMYNEENKDDDLSHSDSESDN